MAIAIRERLAKANPHTYEPDLANSYNNLAVLYYKTQRFHKSEAMYRSAIAIYERLAKAKPQTYEPDLADIYQPSPARMSAVLPLPSVHISLLLTCTSLRFYETVGSCNTERPGCYTNSPSPARMYVDLPLPSVHV